MPLCPSATAGRDPAALPAGALELARSRCREDAPGRCPCVRVREPFPSYVAIRVENTAFILYVFLRVLASSPRSGYCQPYFLRPVESVAPRHRRFPTAVSPGCESVAVRGCARGPSAFSRLSAEALSRSACGDMHGGEGGTGVTGEGWRGRGELLGNFALATLYPWGCVAPAPSS